MGIVHRISLGLALLGLALVPACSDPCQESLDVFPPGHILVTGSEPVEVPHISWTCDDFHRDTIDPPPSVRPDGERRLQVEVRLEAGATARIRLGNDDVPVVPAPAEGVNIWTVRVPEPSQPLIVSICADDQRCALYWVNTYSG